MSKPSESGRPAKKLASPWLFFGLLVLAVLGSLLTGAYPIAPSHASGILADWLWPLDGQVWDSWDWKEVSVITVIRAMLSTD